jgi:hypothetical protein
MRFTVSAVSPWRTALQRERCLPSGVVGPVLLPALRRLASICRRTSLLATRGNLSSFCNSRSFYCPAYFAGPLRRAIQEQRIAVIERLRDATAVALAKGNSSLILAKAKFMQAWISNREIETRLPKILEKYNCPANDGTKFDEMVPIELKALLEDCNSVEAEERALEDARQHVKELERDEYKLWKRLYLIS